MKSRPFALRPVCAAVLLLGVAPLAFGLPEGAVPTFGQTTVKQRAPGRLDIVQTTDRAGLDWTRFSIAAGERVVVRQPGTSSVLLNRVVGNDPTYIYGRLQSNGGVWLVNPRGIVFGANSRVDVGSLLASTLSVAAGDLNPGRVVLGAEPGAGALRADGRIVARDGSVVLAAPDLSMRGVIEARRVGMAAASSVVVDVEGDGLMLFNVRNDDKLATRLSMLGDVRADGGSAELRAAARAGFADTVLNLEGVVRARSLGQRDGRVVIDGGYHGITRVAGEVDVSGRDAGERGGSAQVLGHWVLLDREADVDASGRLGGGQVRIGGDWQGSNPGLHHADSLMVMPGARVQADALDAGNGGLVVMWSDGTTRFHGDISAVGGRDGGDGGAVEVSGKAYLEFRGAADLRAPHGRVGDLLLDPKKITITENTGGTLPAPSRGEVKVAFEDEPDDASYKGSDIGKALESANVTLQATETITVNDGVTIDGTGNGRGTGALKLEARGSISIGDATIKAAGGITLNANANDKSPDGKVSIAAGATLTSGNAIVIDNGNATARNTITTASGSTGLVALTGKSITVNGGVDKSATGTLKLTLNNNGSFEGDLTVKAGTLQITGGGTSTGDGTIQLGNNTVLDVTGGTKVTNPISFAAGAGTVTIVSTSGSGEIGGGTDIETLAPTDGMLLKLAARGNGTLKVSRAIAENTATATAAERVQITSGSSSGTVELAPVSPASSSYTGSTIVDAGMTLRLDSSRALSDGSYQVGNGATLDLAGTFTFDRPISFASGTTGASIISSGGSPTLASGAGLSLADGMTLKLSGPSSGTFTVARAIAPNSGSGVESLTFERGNVTLDAATSITGTTTVGPDAVVELTAANGRLSNGSELVVKGDLTLNAADTLKKLSGSGTLEQATGRITLTEGGDFTGTISGAGGLTVNGGTLRLSRANTYKGGTTVAAGATLQLDNDGRAGDPTSSSARIVLNAAAGSDAGGVLDLVNGASVTHLLTANDGATIKSSAGNGTIAANGSRTLVLADGATLNLSSGSNSTLTISRKIAEETTGVNAESVKVTGGTVVLGAASDYAGGTQITGGTLRLLDDSAAGSGKIRVFDNRLEVGGGAEVGNNIDVASNGTLAGFTGGGTLTGGTITVLDDGGLLKLAGSGGTLTLADTVVVQGGGLDESLTFTGGTVNVGSALPFATITVNQGAVAVTTAANRFLSSSELVIDAGGTLRLGGAESVTSISSAVDTTDVGKLELNGASSDRLTLAATSTLNGTVTGTGGLALNSGRLTLSNGSNTFGGGVRVDNGSELRLSASGAGGTGLIDLTTAGSELNITSGARITNKVRAADQAVITTSSSLGGTLAAVANQPTPTVELADGATLILSSTASTGILTVEHAIPAASGPGLENVTFREGNVTLKGPVSVGGTTRVETAAALTTIGDDRLSDKALVVAGILTLGGDNTVGALSGSGTISLQGNTLKLAAGGSFDGRINGSAGSEVQLTGGNFTLRGSSGAATTDVQAGKFSLASAEILDDGTAVKVASGATLELNGQETVKTATIAGILSQVPASGSQLKADDITLSAATISADLAGKTLTVKDGTTPLSVTLDFDTLNVASNGVLQLTASAVAPQLSGNTNVNVSGRLELSGDEDLGTGKLTLGGGTLAGTGTLSASSYLLDGGNTLATVNLGTGELRSKGASTLRGTKDGGPVIVETGTLTLDSGDASTPGGFFTGSPALTLGAGASIVFDGDETVSSVNLAGTLSGTGTLSIVPSSGTGKLLANGTSSLIDNLVTVSAGAIEVDPGDTLRLEGNLLGTPTLKVGASATFDLQRDTTFDTVRIEGNAIGPRRLTAASVELVGGTASVPITTATLSSTGTSKLSRAASIGTLLVSDGTLTLDDGNSGQTGGLLQGTPTITIGEGGTLALDGPETAGTLKLDGSSSDAATLAGIGRLTATDAILSNAVVGTSTTIVAPTLTVNADTTLRGTAEVQTLEVTAGTLTLAAGSTNGGRLTGVQDLEVRRSSGLQVDGDESAGQLTLGGTLSGAGKLQASQYTLTNGARVAAELGTGTLASSGTTRVEAKVGATTVNVDSGTMTVTGSTLAGGATVTVDSTAELALAGDNAIRTLSLSGELSGSGTLTATTHNLAGGSVGSQVTLAGGTLVVTLDSTLDGFASVDRVEIDQGGQLSLGAANRLLGTPDLDLAGGATLALGGNETVGKLTGGGTVSLGAATLTVDSDASSRFSGVFEGSRSSGLVKRGDGTLTLDGVSSFTGTTQVSDGTLALDGAERLGGRGAIEISGGTLSLNGDQHASSLTMDGGRIDGSGGSALITDRLTTRGDTTLRAGVTAVDVTVADGKLTLAGANLLDDEASVTVNSKGTLALQGSQQIRTLTLSGSLTGTGVLSADSYTLAGGRASAALGGGALTSTGDSVLSGNAAVGSVSVDSGVLSLTGTLTAAPTVTVASAGAVSVATSQTFGSLAGGGKVTIGTDRTLRTGSARNAVFSGVLGGPGSVVKEGDTTFTLNGASSFTGTLQVTDGTLALNGTLATKSVQLSGGTLQLSGAERLADEAVVTVSRGATLALDSAEKIDTLSLAGTLAGDGTLTARSLTLDGAQVDANLGAGALVSLGNSTLAGNAASTSVAVDSGTLTVVGDNRFTQQPTVTVADQATLHLDGSARASSLQLQGTLAGSGTLTAARYALDGGLVQANLGTGALTADGDSRIDGQVAAGSVSVQGGTLTLGAAGRLTGAPALDIASGATLSLGGDESVASLVLAGGALDSRSAGTTLTVGGKATLAQTVLVDGLTLDAASVETRGSTTLRGTLATETLTVQDGTLALATGGRLAARATARAGGPAVTVGDAALLQLGGDESVAELKGTGRVDLGDATLTAGIGGASFQFSGVISGTGQLVKEGAGKFTLTGDNTYSGGTTITAGVLQLGNGGTTGSLGSGAVVLDGTLRVNRSNRARLAQDISGSGGLQQIGSGTLLLSGTGKRYSGDTIVSQGTLATDNANALSAASRLRVDAGAALALVGDQRVAALDVDAGATVSIAGESGSTGGVTLGADGDLNLLGATTVEADRALTLQGASITATNAGNQWGRRLTLSSGGRVDLSAGEEDGKGRDLTLGTVTIGGDAASPSTIEAGRLTLDGALTLGSGALQLVASADATPVRPTGSLLGRTTPAGRQIAFAADTVTETSRGSIDVADGAFLSVRATGGGSVNLDADANQFGGALEVISGDPTAPWSGNLVGRGTGAYSMQSRVKITGDQVSVGGAGIIADVVHITANQLGTAPGAVIVARLPFDNLDGTSQSVPGLTLELAPGAFGLDTPFGTIESPIAVNVGSRSWGNRTDQVDAGYLSVLPRNGPSSKVAVLLSGPSLVGSYDFFFGGNIDQRALPAVYNGLVPDTPQSDGSISATLSVSEGARRQGFEEAVRTENVAPRLRSGVIAEVGPGRSATVGAEGARLPPTCNPGPGGLACAPGTAPK